MNTYSRRQFLKYLGAASTALLVGRTGLPAPAHSDTKPFEMLVLGDSIASGHGLKEENKFYTLAKKWIENKISRDVNIKVNAHSGTTLSLHEDVAAALDRAEVDQKTALNPEINVDYPTVDKQIEIAATEYTNASDVDLILLSGGINDITTTVILDPFGDDEKLRRDIGKYCRDQMTDLLRNASEKFPNARIALLGYFPLVSPKTSSGKFFNAYLDVLDVPRPLKPVVNNLLTKQFFKTFQKRSAKRSRIWVAESNRCFREAVGKLNSSLGPARAVFVESPITEENCFGTRNPLVFGMGRKRRSEDETYDIRFAECQNAAADLERIPGLKYSVHFCRISGLAHPNVAGAKAYADAIIPALGDYLSSPKVHGS